MQVQDFPSIDELLPHRGVMCLLDSVAAFTSDSVRVTAIVDPHAWYADANGAMPAWIGVELMAQAIGAHVGLLARAAGGAPKPGVLLGSQRYEIDVAAFDAHTHLRIDATQILRSEDGQGAYACVISDAQGARCAHAVIKVYQPADFQAFMQGVSN
jgi:predicted hotdog family 3-hydroxylacyl-ACP dehydratase